MSWIASAAAKSCKCRWARSWFLRMSRRGAFRSALLQTIRQAPLFAGLKEDELDCIRRGEVVQVPVGEILVSENEPAECFPICIAPDHPAGAALRRTEGR